MIAHVLDSKKEGSNAICYLCKMSLHEYITNLPSDYKEYDIQREIVSNIYLDSLVQTVLENNHIPSIVLVANPDDCVFEGSNIKINSFKILDGLQRTYRLKSIWETIKLFFEAKQMDANLFDYSKLKLAHLFSQQLSEIDSSSKTLKYIVDFYKCQPVPSGADLALLNEQWFEIWTGLSPDDEVSKMLILNAGHKPVKIKHQLELLFRNLIPTLSKAGFDPFQIIREKELSSINYSKQRKVGQFHFSHLVSAIVSLKEAEPITTNTDFISKWQNNDYGIDQYRDVFDFQFLKKFISCLLEIDKSLSDAYGDVGVKWIGREIVLVGIFSALGVYIRDSSSTFTAGIDYCSEVIVSNVRKLRINEFERYKKDIDLSKVNIGAINKKAVNNAFRAFFSQHGAHAIDWNKSFGGA